MKKLFLTGSLLLLTIQCYPQRDIISLNGTWSIAESVDSIVIPKKYHHLVDLPGYILNLFR